MRRRPDDLDAAGAKGKELVLAGAEAASAQPSVPLVVFDHNFMPSFSRATLLLHAPESVLIDPKVDLAGYPPNGRVWGKKDCNPAQALLEFHKEKLDALRGSRDENVKEALLGFDSAFDFEKGPILGRKNIVNGSEIDDYTSLPFFVLLKNICSRLNQKRTYSHGPGPSYGFLQAIKIAAPFEALLAKLRAIDPSEKRALTKRMLNNSIQALEKALNQVYKDEMFNLTVYVSPTAMLKHLLLIARSEPVKKITDTDTDTDSEREAKEILGVVINTIINVVKQEANLFSGHSVFSDKGAVASVFFALVNAGVELYILAIDLQETATLSKSVLDAMQILSRMMRACLIGLPDKEGIDSEKLSSIYLHVKSGGYHSSSLANNKLGVEHLAFIHDGKADSNPLINDANTVFSDANPVAQFGVLLHLLKEKFQDLFPGKNLPDDFDVLIEGLSAGYAAWEASKKQNLRAALSLCGLSPLGAEIVQTKIPAPAGGAGLFRALPVPPAAVDSAVAKTEGAPAPAPAPTA